MPTQNTMCSDIPEEEPRCQNKTKNKIMCPRCRHDKQRCSLDYDVDKGEKCERCKKMGYVCGAPVEKKRAKKNSRKDNIPVAPTSPESQATLDGLAQCLQSDDRVVRSTNIADQYTSLDSGITNTRNRLPGQRPLEGFSDPSYQEDFSREEVVVESPASQDITRSRLGNQGRAQSLLSRLGALITVQFLLEQDLLLLSQFQVWTGCTDYSAEFTDAVRSFVLNVKREFQRTIKTTFEPFITSENDLGSYVGEFFSAMEHLEWRAKAPQHPLAPVCQPHQGLSRSDVIDKARHSSQKRRRIKLRADQVVADTHACATSPSTMTGSSSSDSHAQHYIKAGEDIMAALVGLEPHCSHQLGFTPQYPTLAFNNASIRHPLYLAARTASSTTLLNIWKQSNVQLDHIDVLGRTLIHYVAYFACVHVLEAIFAYNPSHRDLIANLGQDWLGLTPLGIIACRNDLRSFKLLHTYGAKLDVLNSSGRSILALAARNDSLDIVKYWIHDIGIHYLSLHSEYAEALDNDHTEVAKLLWRWYETLAEKGNDGPLKIAIASRTCRGMSARPEQSMFDFSTHFQEQAMSSLQHVAYEDSNRMPFQYQPAHEQVPRFSTPQTFSTSNLAHSLFDPNISYDFSAEGSFETISMSQPMSMDGFSSFADMLEGPAS